MGARENHKCSYKKIKFKVCKNNGFNIFEIYEEHYLSLDKN